MATSMEFGGFKIFRQLFWAYKSGFPKSLDVSKAIDKAAGAEREVVGEKVTGRALGGSNWRAGDAGGQETVPITAPATPEAQQWQGWGTALKPAHEPIIVACKPYEDGSLPAAHLDWNPCFYSPKASKSERNAGCDAFPETVADPYGQHRGRRMADNNIRFDGKPPSLGRNTHPTVKPVAVMSWLLGLDGVVPEDGLVCDPFLGSGSTGVAAVQSGVEFLGIETESEYADIARARIAYADPSRFRDGVLGILTEE